MENSRPREIPTPQGKVFACKNLSAEVVMFFDGFFDDPGA